MDRKGIFITKFDHERPKELLGVAILGYRVGDEFEWEVPSGKRHLRIEKILYQPEAAGHYDR